MGDFGTSAHKSTKWVDNQYLLYIRVCKYQDQKDVKLWILSSVP